MTRTLFIALVIALLAAAPAVADQVEITSQAKAVHGEFLLGATPPGPAATICLVDTGVNVNPDTAGVIGRLSLTGEATDQSPSLHGTQMAMFIGGSSNGFGMVGIWPAARILSVRANTAGEETFTAVNYIKGVRRCSDAALAYGVKVVAMPASSEIPLTPAEREALVDEVTGARETGISFVAAAGNNGGGPVGTAGIPGVVSVGATDSISGALCSFSATGALLLAPGCSLDGADPLTGAPVNTQQGTSQAAVIAAAALAALRTWRPDLTPDEADRLLSESATPSTWGRNLNATAIFEAAGFGAITLPPPAPTPPTPQPSPTPQAKQQLIKPRITTRSRGHGSKRVLTVKASNRPKGARLIVRVYVRGRGGKLHRIASQTRRSSVVRIRVRSWRRVTARFSDPAGQYLESPARVVTKR